MRGLISGRGKPGVAFAADTALGHNKALPFLGEIGQNLPGRIVFYQSAHRDDQNNVYRVFPGPVVAGAVPAPLGRVMLAVFHIEQRAVATRGDEDDVPAPAAVAAVRPPVRDEFFPPEAHATLPAVAGLDQNFCLVNEFHLKVNLKSPSIPLC